MMAMDKRQRAMLREMGVRVWQPLPEAAPTPPAITASPTSAVKKPEVATDTGAARARIHSAAAPFNTQKQAVQVISKPVPDETTVAAWRVGAAQTLYADSAVQSAARWLVLLEAPASALQDGFNPLDGDAGKLLDNMLHAASLHSAGTVMLAPLVRAGTGGDLPSALTQLLASAKADVVLVMGRLAAQAMLQSTEPLPKLRGQVHTVQNQQTIVTFAPTYLLGNPLEKAKAWDDLCLGLSACPPESTP